MAALQKYKDILQKVHHTNNYKSIENQDIIYCNTYEDYHI